MHLKSYGAGVKKRLRTPRDPPGCLPLRAHQAVSPACMVCITDNTLQSNIRAKRGPQLPLEAWALSLDLEKGQGKWAAINLRPVSATVTERSSPLDCFSPGSTNSQPGSGPRGRECEKMPSVTAFSPGGPPAWQVSWGPGDRLGCVPYHSRALEGAADLSPIPTSATS